MTPTVLLADIGGTNARFALATPGGRPQSVETLQTAGHATFESAIKAYLSAHGSPRLESAAICAAGPIFDGAIRMTNCPWLVSLEAVRHATSAQRTHLLNDFEAVSMALAALGDYDLKKLGRGERVVGMPQVAVGAGTGLGVGGLVADRHGHHIAIASEGGHADLAPSSARELAILKQMMEGRDHVSAERVLSGPGLRVLFEAVSALEGRSETAPSPEEIAMRAQSGACAISREVVTLFAGWLGAFAGDLALTFGARGGIYIAGGIVPQWGALFDEALFRERFEAKGRFRDYLARIPTYIVKTPHVALIGLSQFVAEA